MQAECYPTLREKGQVTIPRDVRDALGLEEGDQLRVVVEVPDTGE